jgi:hypothetical protein
VITPQEMRTMSSMYVRPKSARWMRPDDDEIFRDPVGTFRGRAQERGLAAGSTRLGPSSAFGTSTRFDVKQQACQSHFRETCGPKVGPGYDVPNSFEATLPKTHTLAIGKPTMPTEYIDGRPMRWQVGNQDRTEGTDIGTYQTLESPCFAKASARNYHGQAKYAGHTSSMGTGPRFSTNGGLAGAGHKSHFNAKAGDRVAVRDIRTWPGQSSEWECGEFGKVASQHWFTAHWIDIPLACS